MAKRSKNKGNRKSKPEPEKVIEEEEVPSTDPEDDDEEEVENGSDDSGDEDMPEHDDEQEEEEDSEDDEDDDESDDDEDEEEVDDQEVSNLFKGADADSDEEEGSSDDEDNDDGDEVEHKNLAALKPTTTGGVEQCTFDIRNLVAINSHQLPPAFLYSTTKTTAKDEVDTRISIPLDDGHGLDVNEEYLLKKAHASCAQMISAIWQLPRETSDAGPLATLPSYSEIALPRALKPPPPKTETKWEKFAKAKGIPLNKEKRSRKVWDEATGSWMYRHGYEKANNGVKEWPIMEVGPNDDPNEDPWEKAREAKRARTDRNMENRMKNQERAGNLAKGTTNRVLKSKEKSRKIGKAGGDNDRLNVPPAGVPVDLKSGEKSSGSTAPKLRGKVSTATALAAVQQSTASLGKFDKMREGEPERKKTLSKIKKRKYESATDKKVVSTEGEKSMKILNAVINGGGAAKEKAIRKGQYAKGETAYDYDYNDGLDASSFKKKKGRAGMGKMKKMTKKRAK